MPWGIAGGVRLVLAGAAVAMALVVAAPAQAALPGAPALPVQQTVDTASSAATAAVGAVQQPAAKGVAVAKQVAPRVQPPATPATPATPAVSDVRRLPRPHIASPSTPAVPRVAAPAPTVPVDTSAVEAVEGVGREIGGYHKKLVEPLADQAAVRQMDDAVALVENALRRIAPPIGGLLAPVTPLVTGLRDFGGFDFPTLVGAVSPGTARTLGVSVERGALALPPGGSVSSAPTAGAPGALTRANSFQAASARPPAAEVGGRPESPPPRTAPAPVAGGATASFSGGIFVPFLGLLVLAALAAPRLMRRLDGVQAFVRPAPFLCALERPG